MTKTHSSSQNWSREADQLDFNTTRLPQTTVSGRQSIGAPSVDQSIHGKYTSNVQSAIEDIAVLFPVKINQVIMMEDGTIPDGNPMIERLTIEGTAGSEPVFVYGFPVKVEAGDNRATVTQRVFDELQTVMAQGNFFKSITKVSGAENQIDVEFPDTRVHDNFNFTSPFGSLTILGSTLQEAVAGYGTWTKVGTFEVTNPDTSVKTKINYFKRIL